MIAMLGRPGAFFGVGTVDRLLYNIKPPSHRATEPPSHRATEPPSHRATEPPSHRATEPPSHRATEPPSHRATEPPSHRATEPPSHRATEPPSHRATEPPSHRATEPPSHRATTCVRAPSRNDVASLSRAFCPPRIAAEHGGSNDAAAPRIISVERYRVSEHTRNHDQVPPTADVGVPPVAVTMVTLVAGRLLAAMIAPLRRRVQPDRRIPSNNNNHTAIRYLECSHAAPKFLGLG